MHLNIEHSEDQHHPLDQVEDFLSAHNWVFRRTGDDEIALELAGAHCDYRLLFMWQESLNALHFCCEYDITVPEKSFPKAAQTLMSVNSTIWMGHFDLPVGSAKPNFRHTLLMHGQDHAESINHLIDIGLAQCERFYPLFQMLGHGIDIANDTIALALMETKGQS